MRRKILRLAAALMLGTATVTPKAMAAGRSAGGGHGLEGIHMGAHGFDFRKGHGFRRFPGSFV